MEFKDIQSHFETHHRGVITTFQPNGAAHSSIVVCGAYQGNATLTNVIISGNTVDHYGGGMILSYSNPTLTNVTISGNVAIGDDLNFGNSGGGIFSNYSVLKLLNCILWNNGE